MDLNDSKQLEQRKLDLLKLRRELATQLNACFVASDINSRPTGQSLSIIKDISTRGFWIVAPNRSAKTSTGAREVAWWFLGTHPYKTRPPEWGDVPLLIIVAGRTNQLIEEELWNNKLKPLLPPGSYEITKKDKDGVRAIQNTQNGNRLIFMSHHNAESAREKAQGYTAHVVWLDEMPDDASFVTELLLRVAASGKVEPGMALSGYFYATFTPLVEVEDLRILVDSCQMPFKKYMLRLEDNPIYEGWTSEQLDDMVRALCADDVEFRARRYGEWYYSGERVFRGYNPEKNRVALPFVYHPSLQHGICVDPAASGKAGVTVFVLEPKRTPARWWAVWSKKLEGDAASLLVRQIETDVVMNRRIIEGGRLCDCSPSGFYKEAALQGVPYRPYKDKADKKKDSIEDVNKAFYNCEFMIADTPDTDDLHRELLSAKWKKDEKEIMNSHKYHCADTIRYWWLKAPQPEDEPEQYVSQLHALKQAYINERVKTEKIRQALEKRRQKFWGRRHYR